MNKHLFFVDRSIEEDEKSFKNRLFSFLQSFLSEADSVTCCLIDQDVAAAKPLQIFNTAHPKDALITILGLKQSQQQALLDHLKQEFVAVQDYYVDETVPIQRPHKLGRIDGMCQIALFRHAPELDQAIFQKRWLGDHTRVAIDTQANFGYRQNRVLEAEPQGDWPLMHAVVEENFPAAAMNDRQVFFAAENNPDLYRANEQAMINSCLRFIDFTQFDCVPMSEYILK